MRDKPHAQTFGCARRDDPIVRVLYIGVLEDPGHAFAKGSGQVRPCKCLAHLPIAATFENQKHGAWPGLQARGLEWLIVRGIHNDRCCKTNARHANDESIDVLNASTSTSSAGQR